MVVVLPDNGWGQGISAFGQAIGGGLQQRGQQQWQDQRMRQQEQYRLDREEAARMAKQREAGVLGNIIAGMGNEINPIGIANVMSQALEQGVDPNTVRTYGSLLSGLKSPQSNERTGPEQISQMSSLLQKVMGLPQEEADKHASLWGMMTIGGQTELAKFYVDRLMRGSPGQQSINSFSGQPISDEQTAVEEVQSYDWPEVNLFEDRTPKEKNKLKGDLLRENNKEIKELDAGLRNKDQMMTRTNQLKRLNDSGRLPENMEKLNVNWNTGELRFPALANEETQLFVKTVNDFTSQAKESYGARVTNFDLIQFLKRLPTLANSPGGRRVVIEQMEALQSLDRLEDDAIRQVYDHYGVQNIDRATASKIARQMIKPDEERLKRKIEQASEAQVIWEMKINAPDDHIPARTPTGKLVYIPVNQSDKAKEKNYELLL